MLRKIHHLLQGMTLEKKISYGLVVIYFLLITTFFYYANEVSSNQGLSVLWQWAMPAKTKLLPYEELTQSFKQDMEMVFNPMQLIYMAVPQYKSKSLAWGIYQEEVAGYFGLPKEEDMISLEEKNTYTPIFPTPQKEVVDLSALNDLSYVKNTFYMGGDGQIIIDDTLLGQWDFEELVTMPIRLDETIEGPKVLIFHTHSKEKFVGENTGNPDDPGILAVGEALANLLEDKYGIEALHIKDSFYMNDESLDVTGQYERMEPVIQKIIDENPSLQVSIDIHRDGVKEGVHLVGDYKGEDAAQIMFVNGLCQKTSKEGQNVPMQTLSNPYLGENLAFSMQTQIEMMEYYPELVRKIYLKAYRYSLHMLPYSLLVEVGAQTNTLEEAVRSAEPLAHAIAKVLEKD